MAHFNHATVVAQCPNVRNGSKAAYRLLDSCVKQLTARSTWSEVYELGLARY